VSAPTSAGSTAKQIDCYTCPATLAVTVVPSGSTTIKNWFIGPATVDCSLRSLATEKCPLTISERVKLPKESRFRTLGIATTIAATITDNRNKIILYKLVRLAVQIGCRINCHLDTLADLDLFGYATNEITGKGQFMWL
jgi:hypothetical protein